MKKILFTFLILLGVSFGQNVNGTTAGGVSSVSTASPNLTGGPITSSGTVSTTSNILPTVVSVGAVNAIGAGTTFTITPPASIVNGNPLVAVLAVAGQSSETWTPASGFSQIGANVTNASGDKITLAVFCKIAASESGNYTFTFNNGASGIGVAVILQLGGTTCTPDATNTNNANAATLSVASFATTNTNDLLIGVGVHTNGNPTTSLSNLAPGVSTKQVLNNGMLIASYPNGALTTPAFNFVSYSTGTPSSAGSTNAFAGFVLAFTPSSTSTTTSFVASSTSAASSSGGTNTTGGTVTSGAQQANGFVIPNGVIASSPSNSYAVQLNTGATVPGMGINNANNICLDCGEVTNIVQVGNGIKKSGSIFLSAYTIDGISQDNNQDLFALFFDASNNLWLGCPTSACTGSTQEASVNINAQTGNVINFENNAAVIATVNGIGITSLTYNTTTNCSSSASPAVCGSAASGSVALPTGTVPTLVINTTAVTANSLIFLNVDESLGTKLGVTCNNALATLLNPVVTARTAGTSFTITINATIAVNPACIAFWIVN